VDTHLVAPGRSVNGASALTYLLEQAHSLDVAAVPVVGGAIVNQFIGGGTSTVLNDTGYTQTNGSDSVVPMLRWQLDQQRSGGGDFTPYVPTGTGDTGPGDYQTYVGPDPNMTLGGWYSTEYGAGAGGNPASLAAAGAAGAMNISAGGFADFLNNLGGGMGAGFANVGAGYGQGANNALTAIGQGVGGAMIPAVIVGGVVLLALGWIASPKKI
jgi:hypothetical protein